MTHIVAIISSKGGAGKTTTAVNLAAEYRRAGAVVLVIDADGPQHHATSWLEGSADLAGIDVVTGPSSLSGAIEKAVGVYDVMLIDIMGADTATLSVAAANADLVIIPATPSALDVDGVRRTVMRCRQVEAELGEKGLGREIPLGVLLCRTEPETSLYRCIKADLTDAGLPLLETEVRRRVVYQEAAYVGSAVCHMDDPRARAESESLYGEVEARLSAAAAEREVA